MKICFIARTGSIHVRRWVLFFIKLGYTVHIITDDDSTLEGAIVHKLIPRSATTAFPLFRYLYAVIDGLKMRKIIRSIQPDIIHMHYLRSQLYNQIGLIKQKRLIVSVWGSDIIDDDRRISRSALFARKLLLKNSAAITATSKYLARQTARFTNKKITVVPFGVDTALFKPAEFKKKENQITIGFFKSLNPKYGSEFLIRGFATISQEFPNARLIIAGSGSDEERTRLLAIAAECRVDKKIELVGFIKKQQELVRAMQNCDIIVMPSIYHSETFGVAALEASACGIPVVATNVGGVPEVIIDATTGYLVEPKNATALAEKIIHLIKNPGERESMGSAGRKFVQEHYSWSAASQMMDRIYHMIINNDSHV